MSKSCWQPSHFHMAVFPPRAARLWRMVTHAWAVIISHAGVSSGSLVLPCCCVMPRLGAGLHWRWRSEWSHISPFCKLCLIRARGNQRGTHSLPCDGTAQLRSAQCIGTRSHSSLLTHSHTHTYTPSLSVSLTLTAATTIDADAAAGAAAELFPALLTLGFTRNSFLWALSLA